MLKFLSVSIEIWETTIKLQGVHSKTGIIL